MTSAKTSKMKNPSIKTTQVKTPVAKIAAKISATEISSNDYQKLLAEIQKRIAETQNSIIKTATREKVVMAWQIGKVIDEHLTKNANSKYGQRLLQQLQQDINIAEKVLYKMRSFYKTYPKLPKDDVRLNWSHYRVLSGIKKSEERKFLENLTKQNNWDTDQLQLEVAKSKESGSSKLDASTSSKQRTQKNSAATTSKKLANKKLYPIRGKLFSYPVRTVVGLEKSFLDLGFKIFREVEEALPTKAEIVDVAKKNKNYSVKKSTLHPRKLYAYKAYIERVVDGDTIRVTIDLGFKTFHEEIIRLKGINAPEIKTDEGKKSARALNNILKNVPFLIIKTIKIDIYGRYVADVFFDKKENLNTKSATETDPQKVADEGIYLNQILLDKGLVEVFED